VNSPEFRGGIINGGEEKGCSGVHVRPHLATTRQPVGKQGTFPRVDSRSKGQWGVGRGK
jgi:hypothetical protein